jgi:hypothetical protein
MVSVDKREPDFFSSQVLEANRFYLNIQSQKNQILKVVCALPTGLSNRTF